MSEPLRKERDPGTVDQGRPEKLEGMGERGEAEVSNHFERQPGTSQPCRQRVKDQKEGKPGRKPQHEHHQDATLCKHAQCGSHVSFGFWVAGLRNHEFCCIREANPPEGDYAALKAWGQSEGRPVAQLEYNGAPS